MWFKQKLQELRGLPYEKRLKMLWLLVGLTAILVLAIWIITVRYRQNQKEPKDAGLGNQLQGIYDNLKNVKQPK